MKNQIPWHQSEKKKDVWQSILNRICVERITQKKFLSFSDFQMGIESTPFQTLVDALTTELLSTVNSSDEQVIRGNQ